MSSPPVTETSLAGTSIKEESAVLNGLGDLDLCSSRSRNRRSYGRDSRRSSTCSEDSSPRHQRKSANLEEGEEMQRENGLANGTTTTPKDVRKSSRTRERNAKDESKIVVDTESILDLLMTEGFGNNVGEESEDEGLTMKPPPVEKRSPVDTSRFENKAASTKRSAAETVTSPTRRTGVSEVHLRNRTRSPTNSSVSAAEETKPRTGSPLVETNRNQKTETRSRILERNFRNVREEEEEEQPFRMRGRSNALDMKDSTSLRHKAREVSQRARTDSLTSTTGIKAKPETQPKAEREEEEKPSAKSPIPPAEDAAGQRDRKRDLRRSASIQADEVGLPRSSGSWSRHKHLSGDKALGIFYRSRRSQMLDAAELDEAERRFMDSRSASSSLERSGSLSAPRSPTALRSRDSRSFSPIPSSPLVGKAMPLEPVSNFVAVFLLSGFRRCVSGLYCACISLYEVHEMRE